MPRTTKLELSQLLAARNEELNAARLRISVLEGELALRPRIPAPAPRVIAPRPARVLPAYMVAARELAMRTGCVVKVQA